MGRRKSNSPDIHLNLNVRGLPLSATLAINEKCNLLRKQGRQVYKLGLGQSPFPVPQPVVDALKVNAHQKDYMPVKGLFQLRESVADYHRRSQGINHDAEDVMIGPGSKELMFLLQLVYYGDLVIPTPSWVSYAPQAHIIGRHVRWLPTHRENNWKLTPDELISHCKNDPNKPRIVILNYPSNPSGMTYTIDELKLIAKAAMNHKIILLSDEIYGELHHRGKHVSIARFYPEGTIISGGLSKWCGAGGWRLGTFTFPRSLKWLLDAMAAVASETYTATSAPIQFAAVRAFKGGMKIENYLWNCRTILRRLARIITLKLKDAGVIVSEPSGAFYLFPDFSPLKDKLAKRKILSGFELADRLLEETGVAILPGVSFGRPEHELTARIAYVDFDGIKALAASEQVKSEKEINDDFLETYCGNTLDAIDHICDWLKKE
jgi:aspartate aminotransferase